jgi:hypothetical protein
MRCPQFTQKELARLAVLLLEQQGRLLVDSVKAEGEPRTKILEDADLLARAAVAVVSLPSGSEFKVTVG